MLQYKVLVIQGRGRIIHPHVPRRNAAVRHGTLFLRRGDGSIYASQFKNARGRTQVPLLLHRPSGGREADAPAPDQPGFPRRAGNGSFTITQPRGPFSKRLNCTWELFHPSVEPTITWLQSAGRAAAGKQNAASMHKHRYTAFMSRSITAPFRKKSNYSVSTGTPCGGIYPSSSTENFIKQGLNSLLGKPGIQIQPFSFHVLAQGGPHFSLIPAFFRIIQQIHQRACLCRQVQIPGV